MLGSGDVGTETEMAKAINPRRETLRVLRGMKSNVSTMISRWDQRMTSVDWEASKQAGNTVWHATPEAEKRENSIEEWESLHEYMTAVRNQAESIQRFAAQNIEELRAKGLVK